MSKIALHLIPAESETLMGKFDLMRQVEDLYVPTGGRGNSFLQDGMMKEVQEIFNMNSFFQNDLHYEGNLPELHPSGTAISAGIPQEMLNLMDMGALLSDSNHLGMAVYTTRDLLQDDVDTVKHNSHDTLYRLFHNPRALGLGFNIFGEYSKKRGNEVWLNRFQTAWIIGLLEAESVQGDEAEHELSAFAALEEDKPFLSLFHSERLRLLDGKLGSWVLAQLQALKALGLGGEAVRINNLWVGSTATSGSRDPWVDIQAAEIMTGQGQAEQALSYLEQFEHIEELLYLYHLERGRALGARGKHAEAIVDFDRTLELMPDHLPALMLKGITLRSMNWESSDPEGLQASLSCFHKIIEVGNYRRAEAQHHAGTIYLALKQPENVEMMMRHVLKVEPNPVSRRNLVLALLQQEKGEEAIKEYRFLCNFEPNNAEPLHKYFAPAP